MEKQKKILIISLSIFSVLFITFIMLFALRVVSTLFFALATSLTVILLVCNIMLFIRLLKKMKKAKLEQKKVVSTGDYMSDLYGLLGIPVQYNKDGSVKDIYELLGIDPVYDENGERILTVYELLGYAPKFTQDGKEVPLVFVIKNGVKRIAKVDLSSRVLIRKLTEKEKEELLIKETLKQKLGEAEVSGDKAKAEAISNVLKGKTKNNNKAGSSSKSKANPPKYIIAKDTKKLDFVFKLPTEDKKKGDKKKGGDKSPKQTTNAVDPILEVVNAVAKVADSVISTAATAIKEVGVAVGLGGVDKRTNVPLTPRPKDEKTGELSIRGTSGETTQMPNVGYVPIKGRIKDSEEEMGRE